MLKSVFGNKCNEIILNKKWLKAGGLCGHSYPLNGFECLHSILELPAFAPVLRTHAQQPLKQKFKKKSCGKGLL